VIDVQYHELVHYTNPLLSFQKFSKEQFGLIITFSIQSVKLLALSLLYAWIFNASKDSVLIPDLPHASWNFWSLSVNQKVSTLLLPLFLLVALVVSIIARGRLGMEKL